MKHYFILASLFVLTLNPIMTHASQVAEELGVCLTDSLNGKERKSLAKWIYFGMSTHSTIKQYSNATQNDFFNMNRYVGGLITRLMTEDCPATAIAAFKEGGASAFEYAFGIVGQVAMQEIMAEPNVTQALGAFEEYLDKDKFDRIFE